MSDPNTEAAATFNACHCFDGFTVVTAGRAVECPDGATADGVVGGLTDAYRMAFEAHRRANNYNDRMSDDFAGSWPDHVVMRAGSVVAVVRARSNGRTHVCRFDGLRPRPFERNESGDAADLYDHPTRPGRERHAVRSYRATSYLGRLESVHEGRGLTLDEVIAYEARWFDHDDEPFSLHPPEDTAIFHERQVVAVIRTVGDGLGTVKVLGVGARRAKGPRPTVEVAVDRD